MSQGGCAVRVAMSASSRARCVSRSRNHRRSQCIRERGEFRFVHRARRIHGGGNGRIIGKLQDFQLYEPEHQQRLNVCVAKRMRDQRIDGRCEAQPPSRAVIEQRGQQRAIAWIGEFLGHRGKHDAPRLSGDDPRQCLRSDPAQIGAGIHDVRVTSGRAFR